MATQGLLTIMKDGVVFRKVITGADGYNIDAVLEMYTTTELLEMSPSELYDACIELEFGSRASLVVSFFNENNVVEHYQFTDELYHEYTPWYWDCFFLPEFNPRWARGNGAITRVVG